MSLLNKTRNQKSTPKEPNFKPKKKPRPKKKENNDYSDFTYDGYLPDKLYVHYNEYNNEDDKYEYVPMVISKGKWHGSKFSLP